MLKFLGRGAGFSDEHNGACFGQDGKLILLDCPLVSFIKLKNTGLESIFNSCSGDNDSIKQNNAECVDELIIAITHTHSDHIGGLALTIHYATFVWHINVTVIAPSEEVKDNLKYMFDNMDGCNTKTYRLVTADEYIKEHDQKYVYEDNNDPITDSTGESVSANWLRAAILTTHVPELEGKCFGYSMIIDGKRVIYTGDTNSLNAFLPYIENNIENNIEKNMENNTENNTILYTECSSIESGVHMFVDELLKLESYLKKNGVKVYLMHLDNVEMITEKIKDSSFELAPYCDILGK